ncbi:MAG: M15 family metallopeptidase [Prochlorotrichaceae cyanobacterium]
MSQIRPNKHPRVAPSPENANEDIPLAFRDPLDTYPLSRSPLTARPPWWLMGMTAGFALAILAIAAWVFTLNQPRSIQSQQTESNPAESTPENLSPEEESLLGHRAYGEAPSETLVPIDGSNEHLLRESAAKAFIAMQDAARVAGVSLVPLSAYRSIEDQKYLFFDVKSQRGQDANTRAEVSAPPGYSEHHTGYALDIGDARVAESNLSRSFEDTPAFAWLKENASYYSFELSFPPDNEQGINYEPWHWRFVGDQDSLETFYKEGSKPTVSPTIPNERN